MNKLRVGVLMGGKSIEHEVSFNSGRTVCDHLDTASFAVIPIYQATDGSLYILPWHFLHRGKSTDFSHRLRDEAENICWDDLKARVDFVYLAVHGSYAEDGTIQGLLEVLGIPYLGSGILASALCMNKAVEKKVLKTAGIQVPNGFVICPHELEQVSDSAAFQERLVKENLHFPLVIKPSNEGSSLGVCIVQSVTEACDAIRVAASINREHMQAVLVEERLQGMEFSCIIIQDVRNGSLYALPPTEIAQEDEFSFFDYEQKYMPGQAHEHTPCRCSAEHIKLIQDTCARVTQILEVETISRVDGFLTPEGNVVIFEANTISGMGPASFVFRAAAEVGMSHTRLINHLIMADLTKYNLVACDQMDFINGQDESMSTEKKVRVAVLLGGASNEKEVSLESGRNVVYKLSPHKYHITPVFLSSTMDLYRIEQALLVRNSTKEIESLVDDSMKIRWADLPGLFDFVFLGLHGGLGENGAVQGTLEMLGLPYNGSPVLASALCMDKYKTNEYLRANGVVVPRSVFIEKASWLLDQRACMKQVADTLGFPVIVKPHDDGSSVMVQKINRQEELGAAIDLIFASQKTHAFIEECIVGMELTIGVVGNDVPRALPPSYSVAVKGILSMEEKFMPGAGENQTPAPISKEATRFVQSEVEKAYALLGCRGYARIDCFYQKAEQSPTHKERLVVLEINTLPALTPATCLFHQAAEMGIKPMDLIDLIVQLGFEAHTKEHVKQTCMHDFFASFAKSDQEKETL